MTPRRAALAGVLFVAIAIFYGVFSYLVAGTVDYAGITMLLALGAAMSIMAYVLFRGLRGARG